MALSRAQPAYDVVIVGGGGHGLATAYYLAKEHGVTNVAVLEKGWLGGGNTGRNTTVVRSNYLWEASEAIYRHAHRLWKTLPQALNYTPCSRRAASCSSPTATTTRPRSSATSTPTGSPASTTNG